MPLTYEKEYLDVEEVATILDIHPETVRDLLRQKKLPGRKVGIQWRISRKALDKFMRDEPEETQEERS